MTITPAKRYSALWVSLHWAIAALIFAAFYLGISSEDSPLVAKAAYLRWHMPIGLTILGLMLIRLVVRWRTPHPADVTTGNRNLDLIGKWTHYLLYILAIIMPLSGLALSASFNLAPIVFGGQGSIPAGLSPMLHGLIDLPLVLLISLHILAALYHQFILRDNLLARMGYGK